MLNSNLEQANSTSFPFFLQFSPFLESDTLHPFANTHSSQADFDQIDTSLFWDTSSSFSSCSQRHNQLAIMRRITPSPDSLTSAETFACSSGLNFDMTSASPTMTMIPLAETRYGNMSQESQELRQPFKISKQSKKITKESIHHHHHQSEQSHSLAKRRRRTWKEEEDSLILKLFAQYGPKWSRISRVMGYRSGKQVRDRYLNKLKPGINCEDWTEDEDKLFLSLLRKIGKKWCQIAAELPGRTENQVKNRFYVLKGIKEVSNTRIVALKEAIMAFEDSRTIHEREESSVSQTKSVVYNDVDEYFDFNYSARSTGSPSDQDNCVYQWDDKACDKYEIDDIYRQKDLSDYIPEALKKVLFDN